MDNPPNPTLGMQMRFSDRLRVVSNVGDDHGPFTAVRYVETRDTGTQREGWCTLRAWMAWARRPSTQLINT